MCRHFKTVSPCCCQLREKDAKCKLKPLLDRLKPLAQHQREHKCDLSCVLALEVMGVDGLWPSGYPGKAATRSFSMIRQFALPLHVGSAALRVKFSQCVAGHPIGGLERYNSLSGCQVTTSSWTRQVEGVVADILTHIPANTVEIVSAILTNTRSVVESTQADMVRSK